MPDAQFVTFSVRYCLLLGAPRFTALPRRPLILGEQISACITALRIPARFSYLHYGALLRTCTAFAL